MHAESCQDCHDRPASAFVSYPLARIISPLGPVLNRIRFDLVLWHVHFLACFTGLDGFTDAEIFAQIGALS